MLKFKQFLSEDFPFVTDEGWDKYRHKQSGDALFNSRIRQHMGRLKDLPSKMIGKLGPYDVHYIKQHMPSSVETEKHPGYTYHHFIVQHNDEPVGYASFSQNTIPNTFGTTRLPSYMEYSQTPRFKSQHSGKRALVKHLPSLVYKMAAKHTGLPIVSGQEQSPGGKNLWANLARHGHVVAAHTMNGQQFEYNPDLKSHEQEVYEPKDESGRHWVLIHNP